MEPPARNPANLSTGLINSGHIDKLLTWKSGRVDTFGACACARSTKSWQAANPSRCLCDEYIGLGIPVVPDEWRIRTSRSVSSK